MLFLSLLLACPGPEDSASEAPPCDASGGHICTWAGTGDAGYYGEGEDRRSIWMYFPIDVEFSPYGNPVINDWNNHKIRMVNPDDTVTTIMGTAFIGDGPADQSDQEPPGALGTTVNLNHPTDCVYRPDGILVSASWHTHKMRTWDPATGYVLVFAGAGSGFSGDGGPAEDALLNQPKAVDYDESDGALYIVDMRNERIRTIDADGVINTIGGDGTQGYAGDGSTVDTAIFNFPTGTNPTPGGAVALDGEGGLYIADTLNNRIRRVDLATGDIERVAGDGTAGFAGDGGAALDAQLNQPADIEVSGGFLYVADTNNHRVRRIDLATGIIETVAGNGEPAYAGDDGPALDASLYLPYGIELDDAGNLYIADTFNHVIREVSP